MIQDGDSNSPEPSSLQVNLLHLGFGNRLPSLPLWSLTFMAMQMRNREQHLLFSRSLTV